MTAMDEITRITDDPDLSVVLGTLADEAKERVRGQLEAADARLAGLRETLDERSGRPWETTGISLQTFESGQAMLTGVVTDPEEGIRFSVELRPRNFFDEERPWRPGEHPRAMLTDAWDVEGEVQVKTVTRIEGRKYTVQESAAELPEQRHDTVDAAVAALVSYTDELVELALSRDPVAASWQSEQPDEGDDAEDDASAGFGSSADASDDD
jgi:hypothetical protein